MPTRKKNRVKKNGKKRYMSRKMRGGYLNTTDYRKICQREQKKIYILQYEITVLTNKMNTLNKYIDKAQHKIAIIDHNNMIPTDTYLSDKEILKKFEEEYGSMKIAPIETTEPKKPEESTDDYAAKKTNYNVVKEEYDSFKKIYTLEEEYNIGSTKTRTHDYFKNYKEVTILFNSIKQKYDTIINRKTYQENVKNGVINMIDFKYTNVLIDYYKKIKDNLNTFIYNATAQSSDNLQNSLININKINTTGLKDPTKKEVEEIKPIDDKMYTHVKINKNDEKDDIAYIFYRLHDVELVKTFLEEWLKVLKEEKEAVKVEVNEEVTKEEVEKVKRGLAGEEVEEGKDNEIENKLKELLSKIYLNKVVDTIKTEFEKKNGVTDKIKAVTSEINKVTEIIDEYKTIYNDKANQEIINKIITSKIEEESIKPEYTENMTRKNALEILHVYDEKNSKEIKYKYKMTKDMWTDILNRVTVNDRKPLIKKILNKVEEAYDVLYQDKETTIDINFYKSIFKDNPFPYRELINVTRTGEGVTPIIYGIEELFKLYEDELEFIKDKKSNNAVKPPFKQKKIEIVHKRKNPELHSIFDSLVEKNDEN